MWVAFDDAEEVFDSALVVREREGLPLCARHPVGAVAARAVGERLGHDGDAIGS